MYTGRAGRNVDALEYILDGVLEISASEERVP